MNSTRDQRRASTGSSVNTGGAKNHAEEAQWKPTTASGGGSCGVISKTRLRFFSERRRTDREQAPVAEFLKYLGVIFSNEELRVPDQYDDVDVEFRAPASRAWRSSTRTAATTR